MGASYPHGFLLVIRQPNPNNVDQVGAMLISYAYLSYIIVFKD